MRSRGRIKDLAGGRLDEFIALCRKGLERLTPEHVYIQDRSVVFLFGGRKASA